MPHAPSLAVSRAILIGILVISLSLLLPLPAMARDWIVPDEAPSIAAAMDSCVTGDVVVIQPGTYTDCTTYSNGAVTWAAASRSATTPKPSL